MRNLWPQLGELMALILGKSDGEMGKISRRIEKISGGIEEISEGIGKMSGGIGENKNTLCAKVKNEFAVKVKTHWA